ncbi:hypothetical protein PITCH_A330004 [uncultured Desulfobacterium sp.]|uniref:Uncharacterized protein n=1 Tax=uncultured Desulfobacterium sp. TaxID=201089 RepID=A0A445MZ77_9BACT|nr:hypothetical protein PITCH_A330004 [uncultured Desulfobacterium sp.]
MSKHAEWELRLDCKENTDTYILYYHLAYVLHLNEKIIRNSNYSITKNYKSFKNQNLWP